MAVVGQFPPSFARGPWMTRRMAVLLGSFTGAVLAWTAIGPAIAQTSATYKMTEHVFNEGGHPAAGTALASASYRMSVDAVGDGLIAPVLGSASYAMDAGFVAAYRAPGEVTGVRVLPSKVTLAWDP